MTELNQSISKEELKCSECYIRAPYDDKYEINPSYMNENGYNMGISEKDENEISTIVSDRNKTTYAEFSVNNVQQISDDYYDDDRNKTIDAEFPVINTELIPDDIVTKPPYVSLVQNRNHACEKDKILNNSSQSQLSSNSIKEINNKSKKDPEYTEAAHQKNKNKNTKLNTTAKQIQN